MNRSKLFPIVFGLLSLAVVDLGAAAPSRDASAAGSHAMDASDAPVVFPQRLHLRVLSTRPHDTSAFTQGLLLYEGELYESTGEFGKSTLRRVDPMTGEVRQRIDLDPEFFAEGLARVDQRLIQLTWKNGVAFDGGAQLGAAFRQSSRALTCMMNNFYRNANGIVDASADSMQIDTLTQTLASKGYVWRDLVAEFVVSDAFRSAPAAAITAGNQ